MFVEKNLFYHSSVAKCLLLVNLRLRYAAHYDDELETAASAAL